ncbi:MAG: DUF4230 domain-containing protein [Bacteroidota bacterium]
MSRLLPYLLVSLLAFLLGVAVFWGFSQPSKQVTEEKAMVLLEQVRNVAKLVTVEGDVSEVFNSRQSKEVTFYLPLPTRFSFAKEALVQVQGTVLVGYDLEQLSITIDTDARTLTIGNLPEPDILAIDHQLQFTNLEESWFNDFTAEDYSRMSRQAKEKLRAEALQSELIDQARARGNALVETMRFMAEGAGFELVVLEPLAAPVG